MVVVLLCKPFPHPTYLTAIPPPLSLFKLVFDFCKLADDFCSPCPPCHLTHSSPLLSTRIPIIVTIRYLMLSPCYALINIIDSHYSMETGSPHPARQSLYISLVSTSLYLSISLSLSLFPFRYFYSIETSASLVTASTQRLMFRKDNASRAECVFGACV